MKGSSFEHGEFSFGFTTATNEEPFIKMDIKALAPYWAHIFLGWHAREGG